MISIIFSPADKRYFHEKDLLVKFKHLKRIFPNDTHNVNARDYLYVKYCCNLFQGLPVPSELALDYLGVALSLGTEHEIIEKIIWSINSSDRAMIREKMKDMNWIPNHYKILIKAVITGANRSSVIRFYKEDLSTYIYYFGIGVPEYKNVFPLSEYEIVPDISLQCDLLAYLTTHIDCNWVNITCLSNYLHWWKMFGYINVDKMITLVSYIISNRKDAGFLMKLTLMLSDIDTDTKCVIVLKKAVLMAVSSEDLTDTHKDLIKSYMQPHT